MTNVAELPPPKINFPGPIGTKRRRMRSGGNVSTVTNNAPKPMASVSDEKTTQTSKCKGATTIPIFLKKTYKMIDTCDDNIASWTPEGDMFIVKDPDRFATQIIPQYFDHNKFSSFARQLNFYGFRKMQSKPIRNSDFDAGTAKHVTFYNENFKRGRCDLLKKIQRSTRGGNANAAMDHTKEITTLREQVATLEQKITDMNAQFEDRLRRVELDMLGRMEQMMLTVQQHQQTQLSSTSAPAQNWEPNSLPYPRGNSVNSNVNSVTNHHTMSMGSRSTPSPHASLGVRSHQSSIGAQSNHSNSMQINNAMNFQQPQMQQQQQPNSMAAPTLPPHPKQKQLPLPSVPGAVSAPPDRFNSLRGISGISGISQLSRGLSRGASGLSRGASIESSASAMLMRNSWEDKFFSMLMLDANEQNGNTNPNAIMNPTPIGNNTNNASNDPNHRNNNPVGAPPVVSNRSVDFAGNPAGGNEGDLSSVSSSDIP